MICPGLSMWHILACLNQTCFGKFESNLQEVIMFQQIDFGVGFGGICKIFSV